MEIKALIRLFVGYDPREAVGLHVFIHSILKHTKEPVSITPLSGMQGSGTNSFNLCRFLVPSLCKFEGFAIWMDGADMLCRRDLADLRSWTGQSSLPVNVVKHEYETKHPKKYVGTELEAPNESYPRKNWSSVIVWNCGHPMNRGMTRSFVQSQSGRFLHRFGWLEDEEIGTLPKTWNHLVDEQPHDPDAAIVHFTLGLPGFAHYASVPFADEWRQALRESQRGLW